MKILVTGAAGFIGSHVVRSIVESDNEITGLDTLNDCYDPGLKFSRLAVLGGITLSDITSNGFVRSSIWPNYEFVIMDIRDRTKIPKLFKDRKFDMVCHFAAQPGVKYSLENPFFYTDTNITGFLNILEACRNNNVIKLVYASSSSVYGNLETSPFSEEAVIDKPLSLYAATKRSNELMAYSYSHLFKFLVTGLRLFTVYGPWGRPDMAPYVFTRSVLEGEKIKLFNYGSMFRDFTYIDDVTCSIVSLLFGGHIDGSSPNPYYSVYNIGNQTPVSLGEFISYIESATGKRAIIENHPFQPGDVYRTCADVSKLYNHTGFRPETPLKKGVEELVRWYLEYHPVKEKTKDYKMLTYEKN